MNWTTSANSGQLIISNNRFESQKSSHIQFQRGGAGGMHYNEFQFIGTGCVLMKSILGRTSVLSQPPTYGFLEF